MTETVDPNLDLESFDDIGLATERNRLMLLAKQRAGVTDITTGFQRHLEDHECQRLIEIYNQYRRRAGKNPRAAAVTKTKKSAATDQALMDL
jgi:hypothetical protein